MFVFELPEIGEGVVEGEIQAWLVEVGDVVAADQPICEIMTDKATVELSTPQGGRIARLHGEPGDIIKVHAPLAELETGASTTGSPSTESAKAPPTIPAAATLGPASTPRLEPAPAASTVSVAAPIPAPPPRSVPAPPAVIPAPPRENGRSVATPAVRRHARELGLDINDVSGTGPSGRVTRDDLDTFGAPAAAPVAAPVAAPALPQAGAPPSHAVPSGKEEHIKIIGLRRKIAEQMTKSMRTAPHFTYVDEVDMSALVNLRRRLKPRAKERGVKLTYLPFIMKALCVVFREFPNANANVIEDPFTLVVKGDVNIGIATDTPQGLFVPVVHNVEQKSILQLAAEIVELTQRTREGKARMEELQGGTFTITSVGNIGGMFATPIINHPEVAILGVNKIHKRPVVRTVDGEDSVVIRDMLYLSSSFDHRILDGAVAARFTTALKALLEDPDALMLEMS